MGLTKNSVGLGALDTGININQKDYVVALAGNPNVGKSTVFNTLTGLNQHTGNWAGKTVANAVGYCNSEKNSYCLVDIPGTYSLNCRSAEEEVARNFICFENPDAVVVVCDASVLERNMNLVLQIAEIKSNVIVCVNLLDEAKRKNIKVDLKLLQQRLGVPVIGTVARKKKELKRLLDVMDGAVISSSQVHTIPYPKLIEEAIKLVLPTVKAVLQDEALSRWVSLKLLERETSLMPKLQSFLGDGFFNSPELFCALNKAERYLSENYIDREELNDMVAMATVNHAHEICDGVVLCKDSPYSRKDRKIDKIVTSKRFGYPLMLLLLGAVFWLTIEGANYPSALLSDLFLKMGGWMEFLLKSVDTPLWLSDVIVNGAFRVLSWVVAVMLPPMAIFFVLFSFLEDSGFLARIAFNLDGPFRRCRSCGKQALTMCMGFGCNAAGVVGCRIIDSKRERLLAVLTNNFVPCNGRFPTIIAIITMFFVGASAGFLSSFVSAAILTFVIILGIFATFAVTKILSTTLLKGEPSSFVLEMPSYRKPQLVKVLTRSFLDRTLFVLGRAVAVAIPAGIVIWLIANVSVSGHSLLWHSATALEPLGRLMGLDGVILIAFILGFPANEIVVPIIIMAYMANGTLTELPSVLEMKQLFVANGWTCVTAINVMLFSLFHWPCSTTLLTIKKETGSVWVTFLSAVIPTAMGMALCIAVNLISKLF